MLKSPLGFQNFGYRTPVFNLLFLMILINTYTDMSILSFIILMFLVIRYTNIFNNDKFENDINNLERKAKETYQKVRKESN